MKGVLDTKSSSGYDDDIAVRYEFPVIYEPVMRQCVGDWIVYREPRRNRGRQAYIGVARVQGIVAEPDRPGLRYAYVESFLPLDKLVPFNVGGQYWEAPLRTVGDPQRIGVAVQGKSVRPISEVDFTAIVRAGFPDQLPDLAAGIPSVDLAANVDRVIAEMLVRKKLRDARFRLRVRQAYSDTCAISGLKLFDRDGNPEVQAAHVQSVALGGPDTVQNGIALSATLHWLFDRHMVTIGSDYEIVTAANRIPAALQPFLRGLGGKLILPVSSVDWPHPAHLSFHRTIFSRLEGAS